MTSDRVKLRGGGPARRWLLLIQQLPTHPSSVRIKTWRRLQQIGSVVLKNSVYVLPLTAQAREDFEWLAAEIRGANGQASLLSAEALTSEQEADILQTFRVARAAEYDSLRGQIEELLGDARQEPSSGARPRLQRSCRAFRDELARIQEIDFFGSPARGAAEEALEKLNAKLTTKLPPAEHIAVAPLAKEHYQRRTWVTRQRPGVDRMSCAWLIQRFIDNEARFVFADQDDIGRLPKRQLPFDMFGAEFGHHGGHCSFETLCTRFGINDAAVRQIAEIVHDVDLKDQRYSRAEAATIAKVIDGLRGTYQDDEALLQHGIALFAGLYESFRQTASAAKPQGKRATKVRRNLRRRR